MILVYTVIVLLLAGLGVGFYHLNTTYKEYIDFLTDPQNTTIGNQIKKFKYIKETYKLHKKKFRVQQHGITTLQINLVEYPDHDIYMNEFYIIVDGYNILLTLLDYIKYWIWLKITMNKVYKEQQNVNSD